MIAEPAAAKFELKSCAESGFAGVFGPKILMAFNVVA
jgi:hypothetical protein